ATWDLPTPWPLRTAVRRLSRTDSMISRCFDHTTCRSRPSTQPAGSPTYGRGRRAAAAAVHTLTPPPPNQLGRTAFPTTYRQVEQQSPPRSRRQPLQLDRHQLPPPPRLLAEIQPLQHGDDHRRHHLPLRLRDRRKTFVDLQAGDIRQHPRRPIQRPL